MSKKSDKSKEEVLEEVQGEEVTVDSLEEPEKEEKEEKLSPVEEKELEIAKLKKELEEAQFVATECKNQMLRNQADLENFRKRLIREKENHARYSNESLINDLLSPLDNFERAIKASEEAKDFDSIHDGVVMVNDQLHSMLEKNWGLKKIECKGKEFDPSLHEAYMMEQSEDFDKEIVLDELATGYTLHDRVLRPAKVKVGKPL